MLIDCKICGGRVSSRARYCPHCLAPVAGGLRVPGRAEEWEVDLRVVGTFAVLGLIDMLVLLAQRDVVLRNRGVDLYRLWPFALWLLVSSVGLFRCTRWGVAIFAIPVAALLVWWCVVAVVQGSYASLISALAFSPIVIVPAVVTIRSWNRLRRWW